MLRPKYITFDCYGTLTWFRMGDMTREMFADRIAPDRMAQFLADFRAYRLDQVMGAWEPYVEIIKTSLMRTCKRWGVPYREAEAVAMYEAVPTWGPHPDVAEPLARIAKQYPLVILSNAMDSQIHHNVAKLGAPFHAVYTAQQAQAYKPRLQAFEYLLDKLGCAPEDLLHVSSHIRYDLMSCADLGIKHKVYVQRGYEPEAPGYEYHLTKDIHGLAALLGL